MNLVDRELIEELDELAVRQGAVTKLSEELALAYCEKIADRFVLDVSFIRWWESLKTPITMFEYGEADGLIKLRSMIDLDGEIALIVTDETERPWPVYTGRGRDLLEILSESRFFEFILAPQDMRYAIFDTHMNQLIYTVSVET